MKPARRVGLVVLLLALAPLFTSDAAVRPRAGDDSPAVAALKLAIPEAQVTVDAVTGDARLVRLPEGSALGRMRAATAQDKAASALSFLARHGAAFGLHDAARELDLRGTITDRRGETHLTFEQRHDGVPVFGTFLKAHFDRGDHLKVVNGTVLSGIRVASVPTRDATQAASTAVALVGRDDAQALGSRLLVYREGLAQGAPGADHLVWEVEVGNGADVREFVYVDAHTGKVVDRITGIFDALDRRAYDAQGATAPGPNYPHAPYWLEGDFFPTASGEANNMILASGEIYDTFDQAFGRDSFDAAGALMDSIFNRGNGCPNASWNGLFISFCPGTTSDDVTAHEWGHAYTQYTHDLIYQWQPGALNESYSDIWGEVVDLLNGRGSDLPGGPRAAGVCSSFTQLPPTVTIHAPAAIAGVKGAGTAAFGPAIFTLTNDVVLADDGVVGTGTLADGCCAGPSFVCAANSWPNAAAIAGKFAMVDRGVCGFAVKVKNAQLNGAVGVIVGNNQGGTAIINMGGADPTITVPSLSVTQNDGTAIKAQLASTTVNATLSRGATGPDNSYRWLIGEDASAFGGAIRDMWNPTCYRNAGKVSDAQYTCSTADGGGVHSNSGVPNHAFALVVDGGTYNGETVTGLGVTKAAHIYYRAQSVYQGPASNFADHADALEQSCADLIGDDLADLGTGAPSGEVLTASDCDQVAAAAAAVELRTPPSQCNFQPLLAQSPPPLCDAGGFATPLFHDDFDRGHSSAARWSVSHDALTADFTPRDWEVVADLPDHRTGSAFFGADPDIGTCAPGGDESGVLHLVSPKITLPAAVTAPRLTFDHWVATEPGYDGGNLKISVNDGPWQLIPAADFVYNPYNTTLVSAPGNTNPIAGQPAFSGNDGGAVDGTWGRSIVDLAPFAGPKDKIRLRFDLGTDGCGGRFGWYIDDLMVYRCH